MCHQRVFAKEPDIRFAVYALEGEREGPDTEKKIVIERGRDLVINTDWDGALATMGIAL